MMDLNGTMAMGPLGGGVLGLPLETRVDVRLSGDYSYTTPSSTVVLPLNNEVFDTRNEWNTTGHYFTPIESGIYMAYGLVNVNSFAAATIIGFTFDKGSPTTDLGCGTTLQGTGVDFVSAFQILSLTSSDQLQIKFIGTNSGTVAAAFTNIQIYRLR